MNRLPITKLTGVVSLAVVAAMTLASLGETTHATQRVDWPASSETVEATFEVLPAERFGGFDIGVELDPSATPPKDMLPSITIEAWNAETGAPVKVMDLDWTTADAYGLLHYCGPDIWSVAGINESVRRFRVRARTTEATPPTWRSHTGLAMRRGGALSAEQRRRFQSELSLVLGGSFAVLLCLGTFLVEKAAEGPRPSKAP